MGLNLQTYRLVRDATKKVSLNGKACSSSHRNQREPVDLAQEEER
jgi:hypothetical protein